MTRFDEIIEKPRPDGVLVTAAGAVVDFYLQGATVHTTVSVPNNTTTDVLVYSIGSLKKDMVVMAGPGGAALTIEEIPTEKPTDPATPPTVPLPFPIKVKQTTGSALSLTALTTRLIPTSARPRIYRDPSGTIDLGSSLTADSMGRVLGYISEARFDYLVHFPVVYETSSTASGAGVDSLSWAHTGPTTPYGCVLVGFSLSAADLGSISVTYGGQPMSEVRNNGFCALFRLVNPPAGAQTIVITLSQAADIAAGAANLSSVDQSAPIGANVSTVGTTSPARATLAPQAVHGLLFDVLCLPTQGNVSATSLQTQRWNLQAGSNPTRGAASSKSVAALGSQNMDWTLGQNATWKLIAAEIKPIAARLVVDAIGGTVPSPAWINARDYATLDAALAAIPRGGGTLYIPPGRYARQTTDGPLTLLYPNTHIFGDGLAPKLSDNSDVGGTVILCDPNGVKHVFHIKASNCSIRGLMIRRPAGGGGSGTDGIHIGTPDNLTEMIVIEDVEIRDMPRCGIYIGGASVDPAYEPTNSCLFRNIRLVTSFNLANLFIGRSCTTLRFVDVIVEGLFNLNNAPGVLIENASIISFENCNGNAASGQPWLRARKHADDTFGGQNLVIAGSDIELGSGNQHDGLLIEINDYSHVTIRDNWLFNSTRGILLKNCKQCMIEGTVFKVIGTVGSPHHLELEGATTRTTVINCAAEGAGDTASQTAVLIKSTTTGDGTPGGTTVIGSGASVRLISQAAAVAYTVLLGGASAGLYRISA